MSDTKKQDAGQAETQKLIDKAEEKGYIGETPDPRPNSAYSLESGPDSPGVTDAQPGPPRA